MPLRWSIVVFDIAYLTPVTNALRRHAGFRSPRARPHHLRAKSSPAAGAPCEIRDNHRAEMSHRALRVKRTELSTARTTAHAVVFACAADSRTSLQNGILADPRVELPTRMAQFQSQPGMKEFVEIPPGFLEARSSPFSHCHGRRDPFTLGNRVSRPPRRFSKRAE